MSFLRDIDLYKGVILLSLILLPLAGWWIYRAGEEIKAAERAVVEASRNGGYIEEIGKLQRQIEIVERNKTSASQAKLDHGTYFQGQIYQSAKNQAIGTNDFQVSAAREEGATTGSKQSAKDYVVKIDFVKRGNKDLLFTRELLFAVLFNCESGARGGESQLPSIWKLRSLELRNEALAGGGSTVGTPPLELEDSWVIRKLEFARREPAAKSGR